MNSHNRSNRAGLAPAAGRPETESLCCRHFKRPQTNNGPSRSVGMRVGIRGWLLPVVLVLSAPASRAGPPPLSARETGDLAIRARAVLRKYCHECHGGRKTRGNLNVLDHGRLVATGPHPVPFVVPGDPAASQVLHFVEDGSMPPGGKPRPGRDEVQTLRQWVAAGAPRFPATFDESGTLRSLLDDVKRQPPEAVPHLRYLSLAHLVRDDAPPPDLHSVELELRRSLQRVGMTARPVPVDVTATLFRLDSRGTAWENRELFSRVAKGAPAEVAPLTAYDLLLLEYPHGSGPPADPVDAAALAEFLTRTKAVRPVPFLRADWVAAVLGEQSPLAEELKSLAELSEALGTRGNPALGATAALPCGPKVRAFAGRNPLPAAPRPPTDSTLLPLFAWYSGDCRTEPPPFNLKAEVVDTQGNVLKTVTDRTPFRLRVTTDRDVRFVLLMVWSDGTVVTQPTRANGLLKAGETLLSPTEGGTFRITGVLTGEPRATEYFVILASPTELPPVVIVRSRHATRPPCRDEGRFPVYRFFFDPEARPPAGFDPARVVRVVVPVTVEAGEN